MEQTIGTIREFNTRNFRVTVVAQEDYDVDLSFDDTGEVRRKLESGEFVSFQVAVTVTHTPTGIELGADYLGGCIYRDIDEFQDHRECGRVNRRRLRREGRFQIYRKARKYEGCLTRGDKLRKRGLATRERAEDWARTHATEPWEVMESGQCGSYFADMIARAIEEARKNWTQYTSQLADARLRTA